ncbi:hypothetical protein QQS21_005164 [Conoideocrella luteorostrata]|uniref:Heterokaryon incompatibility domain-containing protein n=1 Tax=Conoideocrella luteorostrata TaxID=1105319 RepID=A0AAJ0CPW7_9HYPO|nr:hypothetical protein QQS21_005164 [Conoideocrella luteorostrata]
MDHLARPRADLVCITGGGDVGTEDHAHSFKVLFLHNNDFRYDSSQFADLPVEKLIGDDDRAVASCIQSWLFFGLMNELFVTTCGIDYDWRDFVQTEPGGAYSVINTSKLDTLIYLWHAREADEPAADKFERLDRIVLLLMKAQGMVSTLRDLPPPITAETNLDNPADPGYPVVAAVLLSVKILGMTLCEALPTVYSDFVPVAGAEREPLYSIDTTSTQGQLLTKVEFHSSHDSDPIVSQLLERAGYCPYQAETCDREYLSQGNLGLRWYLTFLDRRNIPGDHSKCTTEVCVGYQMDEATYETKHFMGQDCACEPISLSHGYGTNLVLDCIRRGGTPLIQFDRPYLRIFQMGVDEGPPPPYVAISHVWSEGMGNPRENALPQCQMSILQYAASNACPDVENIHFWIDTLCVPVGCEEERTQEIKKMAGIFSAAEKVVVLDRSLMEASSNTYREEVLLRIWRSPWASRLWTLQEGRLSKSLSFFFADKFFELQHVGVENALAWHNDAIYYQTDLPSWMERYKKAGDPMCYRMIECGAKLDDPGSVDALEKVQQLETCAPKTAPIAPTEVVSTSLVSRLKRCHKRFRDKIQRRRVPDLETPIARARAREIPPLAKSFVSRINRYNKYRVVRLMANNSFQSIGSLPPSHRYSSGSTAAELFHLMLASLTTRSLTRPEDEAVCLATTLGTDLGPMLRESSPDERMRVLLTSVGTLPLGILFVDSERLRDENARWIPRTLLRRGARNAEGTCVCQPDGRLLYQGIGLISTRPFTINKEKSYFIIAAADGNQYFVGIQPQPRLEIDNVEKTYLIIPSRPPLARDRIPQRVAIVSLSPEQGTQGVLSLVQEIQTRYEFTAWLFDLMPPGSSDSSNWVLGGSQTGEYQIWQPPKKHSWRLDLDTIDTISYDSIAKDCKVLIG